MVTDDFAGSGALGAGWAQFSEFGVGTITRSSGVAVVDASSQTVIAYRVGEGWTGTQCSQATIGAGRSYVGLFARMSDPGWSTFDGYWFSCADAFVEATISLFRIDNGVVTTLDSGVGGVADGDVVELCVSGASQLGKINGVTVLSASDATYASGVPGFGFYRAGADPSVTDWTGTGEVATGYAPSAGAIVLAGAVASLRYQINMPDEL